MLYPQVSGSQPSRAVALQRTQEANTVHKQDWGHPHGTGSSAGNIQELLPQSCAVSVISPRCRGSVQAASDVGGSDMLQLPSGKRDGISRLQKSELIKTSGLNLFPTVMGI